MLKIVTVIGARPQFIKAAALSRHIRENSGKSVSEIIVHTGQHYDQNMSEIFFSELEIPRPDHQLNIGSGSHGIQTGKMLAEIEKIVLSEKPDYLLVYGDTNSTLAGALAASKQCIPVIHIEAGLRSNNMFMPEEQNRILTDHISDILFCPTETAITNLKNEGIVNGKTIRTLSGKNIIVENVGDIMFEAVLFNIGLSRSKSRITQKLGIDSRKYALATIHRAENTDSMTKLQNILEMLHKSETTIILALHPRTRKFIATYGLEIPSNVMTIDPVGYLDMLCLEANASMIITDSGGVQKEAFFAKVPCITLREETEWVETVESGWNTVVGTDPNKFLAALENVNTKQLDRVETPQLFGDGKVSEKIIKTISNAK